MSSRTPTTRPPITCHVLDTTTGRPAANLAVKLSCVDFPDVEFVGTTNADGRIAAWANGGEGAYVESKGGVIEALEAIIEEKAVREESAARRLGSSLWKLQFNTGAHYGVGNTFFPVVELSFLVVKDEHFHVPLLLGPYSFTTYRGS
ncbi:transthyretin-like protein-like protein [Cadophora sp. MPI-SDFR-AT-0126]|nr:transthyretin-like protein-like protein [Leotiomycetes sp. MPI-SDFR-AT-0126]